MFAPFDDFKVTHTKSPIISADDYYPFGLAIQQNSYQRESAVDQRYKYNGKELQSDLGLDWHDYGARMYDAAIGRWHAIDPLASNYMAVSPYNYVLNNPLSFIDPDGMRVRVENEKDQDIVKLSVSEEEAKFVKFNKKGFIKKGALRRGARKLGKASENFEALGSLVESEREFVVAVSDPEGDFEETSEIAEDLYEPLERDEDGKIVAGNLGSTEPNESGDLVIIKIHGGQTKAEQAETFSHEAFGHAFFFGLQQQGKNVDPWHKFLEKTICIISLTNKGEKYSINCNRESFTIILPHKNYSLSKEHYTEGTFHYLVYPDSSYIEIHCGSAVHKPFFEGEDFILTDSTGHKNYIRRKGKFKNTNLYWQEDDYGRFTILFNLVKKDKLADFNKALNNIEIKSRR